MSQADLTQFLDLSDQLVALVKAGVPVHLGLSPRPSHAAIDCERMGAFVARRLGEGVSLDDALRDSAIPHEYRTVVQLALGGGSLPAALVGARNTAQQRDEARHAVRAALRYPLMICMLAYAGVVLFCLTFVPKLEAMYQSMGIRVGWGLATGQLLSETLPYWVIIPPLVLVLVVLWLRWPMTAGDATRSFAWIPDMAKLATEQELSRFADTLAGHLEAGLPFPAAMQSAAAAWDSDARQKATLQVAAELARGQSVADLTSPMQHLPPLLRWAIWQADDSVGRSRALRMTAELYRNSAERRTSRLRVLAPVVTCVVIGGGVTLLYALALFVPVAQMIQGLAG
jgi:type II secretory pathway component PulF